MERFGNKEGFLSADWIRENGIKIYQSMVRGNQSIQRSCGSQPYAPGLG
jgi:hypothetical protein